MPHRPPAVRSWLCACVAAVVLPAAVGHGSTVRFDTNLGTFDVELYDAGMPITVTNFLSYVNANAYDSTLIHRSTTYDPLGIQIVQGGGYVLSGNSLALVATSPPIVYESGTYTNARGTIAMARGAALDSATSQFYFNVQDNPALDGNYAVFGMITGTAGLAVMDAIAGVPVYDASVQLGPAFSELPLLNPELTSNNLVVINGIAPVPEPSTLVLAGVGLAAAAFTAARRSRRLAG